MTRTAPISSATLAQAVDRFLSQPDLARSTVSSSRQTLDVVVAALGLHPSVATIAFARRRHQRLALSTGRLLLGHQRRPRVTDQAWSTTVFLRARGCARLRVCWCRLHHLPGRPGWIHVDRRRSAKWPDGVGSIATIQQRS